jgi:hypothetical protein
MSDSPNTSRRRRRRRRSRSKGQKPRRSPRVNEDDDDDDDDDEASEDLTPDSIIAIPHTNYFSSPGPTRNSNPNHHQHRLFRDEQEEDDVPKFNSERDLEEEHNRNTPLETTHAPPRPLSCKNADMTLCLLLALFLCTVLLSTVVLRSARHGFQVENHSDDSLIGGEKNNDTQLPADLLQTTLAPSSTESLNEFLSTTPGNPTLAPSSQQSLDNVLVAPTATNNNNNIHSTLPPTTNESSIVDETVVVISAAFQCANAQPIPNGTLVLGSTRNAYTMDQQQQDILPPVCGGPTRVTLNGAGVWFQVLGDGNVWSVDTCHDTTNFDTQLSVWEGTTSSCNNNNNNNNNDDDNNTLVCTTTTTTTVAHDSLVLCQDSSRGGVSWYAQNDMYYFLYVHGSRTQRGEFALHTRIVEQDNGACNVGHIVDLSQLDPFVELIGSTRGLVVPPPNGSSSSSSSSSTNTTAAASLEDVPGMWYRIAGGGSTVTVSTCSNSTTVPAEINIFTSENNNSSTTCENLSIVETRQDETCPNSRGAIITFDSTLSQMYHIKIQTRQNDNDDENGDGGEDGGGEFGLLLLDSSFAPAFTTTLIRDPLDECRSASKLSPSPSVEIGELHKVPTNTLTTSNLEGTCGETTYGAHSAAKWYVVNSIKNIVTGTKLTASTCHEEYSTFDTQLTVFQGSDCDNLECVTGNDQFCGDQSSVTWELEAEQTY